MLSYTALAFTSVLVALLLEWKVIRSGILKTSSFYLAYLIVLGFQLLTNGYLTSNEIVQYNEETIIGLRVAFAPLEDLLFGFSLVMLTMAVWVRLGTNETSKARKSGFAQ
jgi:lycopene cyclase domain-containing protein